MSSEPFSEEECLQFEERVQDLLDQRISPLSDCDVARHAAQCPECTKLLQSFWVLSQSYDCKSNSTEVQKSGTQATPSPRNPNRFSSHLKKIIWSFGPSFAALLFVGLAIFFSDRPNFDHELVSRFEEKPQAQRSFEDDTDDFFGPQRGFGNFISSQMMTSMASYPRSVNQIVRDAKDWTDPSGRMPQKLIGRIAQPLTPIQSYVPDEVSVFVQLQHYFGVAWKLLNLSFGNTEESGSTNRDWHPVPHDWNVA